MKTPNHIAAAWPATKGKAWPRDIGTPPPVEAVNAAAACGKLGTAVSMALAMYLRPGGATAGEAATAAGFATGASSAAHLNKLRHMRSIGRLADAPAVAPRGGQVYAMRLPAKGARPAAGKANGKAKGGGQGKAKATGPVKPATPPAARPEAVTA